MFKRRAPRDESKKRRRRPPLRRALKAGTLGKQLRMRFKYAEKIDLVAGIGTPGGHVFSANGLDDPNISGVGHQPMGFDQLVGVFYQHYTVTHSTIKVTFFSSSSSADTGCGFVTVEPNGSQTLDTDIYDIIERGKATTKPYNNSAAGGVSVNTITKRLDLSKFLSQDVMQEDSNMGTHGGNPAEQVYWHINTQGVDTSANPSEIRCLVEIWYDAILHEPKDLVGS